MDRAWLIQGYDGLKLIFRAKVSAVLSEREIAALLQRLASRHLTMKEVVQASLRKSAKGYSNALRVRTEPNDRIILSVGNNPEYVASLHTKYEFDDIERS